MCIFDAKAQFGIKVTIHTRTYTNIHIHRTRHQEDIFSPCTHPSYTQTSGNTLTIIVAATKQVKSRTDYFVHSFHFSYTCKTYGYIHIYHFTFISYHISLYHMSSLLLINNESVLQRISCRSVYCT